MSRRKESKQNTRFGLAKRECPKRESSPRPPLLYYVIQERRNNHYAIRAARKQKFASGWGICRRVFGFSNHLSVECFRGSRAPSVFVLRLGLGGTPREGVRVFKLSLKLNDVGFRMQNRMWRWSGLNCDADHFLTTAIQPSPCLLPQMRRHLCSPIRAFSSTSRTMSQKIKIGLKGDAILNSPRFNKGTAFSQRERDELGIRGRLPFS